MAPAGRGSRVSLGDINPNVDTDTAPVPATPRRATGDSVPWQQVAPNPLNKRDVAARPEKIAELADSLREFGQIEPCTVVGRVVFTGIFPEYEATVRDYQYVQVSGARRRAAAREAGLSTLDVSLKNHLAESRTLFIAATLAENADREDLDPVEEAYQVQLLVQETGTGRSAAEHMHRTPGWVTQRLNLLKLVPELREAVRTREIPVTEVRELHRAPEAEQLAALHRWRAQVAARERREQQGDQPVTSRRSRAVARTQWLREDYTLTVSAIRAELPPDEVRAVAEHARAFAEALLRDLDDQSR
jgi:ParB family chromosome partitioning protein